MTLALKVPVLLQHSFHLIRAVHRKKICNTASSFTPFIKKFRYCFSGRKTNALHPFIQVMCLSYVRERSLEAMEGTGREGGRLEIVDQRLVIRASAKVPCNFRMTFLRKTLKHDAFCCRDRTTEEQTQDRNRDKFEKLLPIFLKYMQVKLIYNNFH